MPALDLEPPGHVAGADSVGGVGRAAGWLMLPLVESETLLTLIEAVELEGEPDDAYEDDSMIFQCGCAIVSMP
jgi:hypothetical protein